MHCLYIIYGLFELVIMKITIIKDVNKYEIIILYTYIDLKFTVTKNFINTVLYIYIFKIE